MQHVRDLKTPDQQDEKLDEICRSASELSFDAVDIAATMYQIDQNTERVMKLLGQVDAGARRMLDGNTRVQRAITAVGDTITTTLNAVEGSVDKIRGAGHRVQDLAAWVKSLDDRVTAIEETLEETRTSNDTIAHIAKHVNILAINAKIEAARAGDAGKGFAVVAEAINDLSRKTAAAAEGIDGNITGLVGAVQDIREQANSAGENADKVLEEAKESDQALSAIADHVHSIHADAKQIHASAAETGGAIEAFQVSFTSMGHELEDTGRGIHQMRKKTNALVDRAESMFQSAVALGGKTQDGQMIAEIQRLTKDVQQAFEAGIDSGEISMEALFSRQYTPIPGTNPQQVMAPFTEFTDKVLPPIQEAALEIDPKIVFCAAVDTKGYLPTHNKKFSKPQGSDPDWNMANSRNRRIFDDRVGRKAAQNTQPFLLQIYRRDMGGGEFVLLKDLSAPIMVKGRHWGGLRLAYTA